MALVSFEGCSLRELPSTTSILLDTNLTIPTQWDESLTQNKQLSGLEILKNPQLEQLISEALQHNLDLRLAAARVEQASAYVTIAGGSLVPTINAMAGISSKHNNNGASSLDGWGINATWEADIWGRVRYQARAAESTYTSVKSDEEYARQSIISLVTKGWLAASEAQLQQEYINASIQHATKNVSLLRHRLSIGISNESELLQAQNTLLNLQDQLLQAVNAHTNALRSLELLVGHYPHTARLTPQGLSPLSSLPDSGIPSELLEHRPDIIAARYRLLVAFDKTHEANAARLPKISLNAMVSELSSNLFVLQNRGIGLGIGAGIFAPIFNNGALKAQEELRRAEQMEAQINYEKIVLNAFYNVENTLSFIKSLHEREKVMENLILQNDRSIHLESSRYAIGSRDMRPLINAQISQLQSKLALLRIQSELRIQHVNLYYALGQLSN